MKLKHFLAGSKYNKGRSSSLDILEKDNISLPARSSHSLPRSITETDEELLVDLQTHKVISAYQVHK